MNYKKWDAFAKSISDSDSGEDSDGDTRSKSRGNMPTVTVLEEGSRINIGPSGTTLTERPSGKTTTSQNTTKEDYFDGEDNVLDIGSDGSFDIGKSSAVKIKDKARINTPSNNEGSVETENSITDVPKINANILTDKLKSQWMENGSKTKKFYWCQNKKEVILRLKISNDLRGKDISFKYYIEKSTDTSAIKRKLSIFEYNAATKKIGKVLLEGFMRYDVITNNDNDNSIYSNNMNNPSTNPTNGFDGSIVDWEVKSYFDRNEFEMKIIEINFIKKCPIPNAIVWWKSIFEIDTIKKDEALKKILKKSQQRQNKIDNMKTGDAEISFTMSQDERESDDDYNEYFGEGDKGSDNEHEVEVDVINIPGRKIDMAFVDSWNQAHDHIKNKMSGDEAIAIDLDN